VTEHGSERELWIGTPALGHGTSFTLSARSLDSAGTATFGWFGQELEERLLMQDGGRTASGFPTHGVLSAEVTEPGCGQVNLDTEDFQHTITVLPASPPSSP